MATGRHILTKTPIAHWARLCGRVVPVCGSGSRGREGWARGVSIAVTALEQGRHFSSHPVMRWIEIHILHTWGCLFCLNTCAPQNLSISCRALCDATPPATQTALLRVLYLSAPFGGNQEAGAR